MSLLPNGLPHPYIYAPCALPPKGPAITKSQADRAGQRIREWLKDERGISPDELPQLAAPISAWRTSHAYPQALVTPGVRNWVSQETRGEISVGQRLKRFDRLCLKLVRFPHMRLTQIEDIGGCRAVLMDPGEVEAVEGRIRRKWEVRGESDYREAGKPATGYRALHLVVRRRERLVEVQLRTQRQHYWAEQVERTSSRTSFNLKDGEGPPDLLEYFRVASDITWLVDNGESIPPTLQDRLEELRVLALPYFVQDDG